MNLQKCENGHFYDADKYQSCPHCQNLNDDMKTQGRIVDTGVPMSQTPTAAPSFKQAPPVQQYVPQGYTPVTPSDDAKTVGIFQRQIGDTQPVVGWLVCVQGKGIGKSFCLHEGKNFIGRGEDMDIVIREDMAVARKRHACVIFEPRAGVFYAQPGESHELFYLNDNVVLNSEILKKHDVITLGETGLLFVPLCGDGFSWDTYRNK